MFFALEGHSRKFNPVAHSRIASSDDGGDRYTLLLQVELYPQHGARGHGHDGFHVAAIAAHVGGADSHGRVDPLVAQFDGKRDLVPWPAPPVAGLNETT
jgi:hypothetical protein